MRLARVHIRVALMALLVIGILGLSTVLVINRSNENRLQQTDHERIRTPVPSAATCISGWHISSGRLVPGNRLEQPLGVAAVSWSDVWAVGRTFAAGSSTDEEPLTEHFDGTRWRAVTSPKVPGGSLEAAAAVASDDVWAVGNVNMV